jgi:4-hydroxy-3-polyprenylbenzoate decarboxylase
VYPATVVGIPPQEDACLSQAVEKIFLAPVRMAVAAEVRDLHLPFEGVSHNIACVKIENSYPGQAIKTAHALWGTGQMMCNKILIVVDGDVNLTDYPALWQTILANYRPEHDTYFSHGPLDILDHATATPGFGGKICIDATTKRNTDPSPALPEGGGTLPPLLWKGLGGGRFPFVFRFDDGVDTADFRTCAWLLGNHIDAVRDCKVVNRQLVVDARSKVAATAAQAQEKRYPARWPNVICAHRDTIAAVNAKWPLLGLGDLLPSPSLKYAGLVRPGDAAVMYEL